MKSVQDYERFSLITVFYTSAFVVKRKSSFQKSHGGFLTDDFNLRKPRKKLS